MIRQPELVVLRALRDWRKFIAAVVVTALVAVTLGARDGGILRFILLYGIPFVSFATISALFEYSQRASVWLMLAQHPGTDVGRLWTILRVAALVYLCAILIIVGGVLGGAALNEQFSQQELATFALTAALWTLVVGCAVMLTSTAARKGTASLAIGWLAMPFLLVLLQNALGFSDQVVLGLEFLAPPFNAVFSAYQMMSGDLPERTIPYTAQLISFPVLCVVATHYRLKMLAKPDQSRIE